VHLGYVVTAADLQHTTLWAVNIALATPGALPLQSAAQGTVNVQQPPGDPAAALAEANSVVASAHNRPRPAPELAARLDAARASLQAQADQDAEQRRAAVRAAQQPMIDQLWGRASSTVRSRGVAESGAATSGSKDAVGTRSLPGASILPGTTIKAQPVTTTLPLLAAPPTLTLSAPPPPPAPVITNVFAGCGFQPAQPVVGGVILLAGVLQNTGIAAAQFASGVSMLRVTFAPPLAGRGALDLRSTQDVATVVPGSVYPQQLALADPLVSPPAAGAYQVTITADPDNRIAESNKGNNVQQCTLVVAP
jgi:hypothetical protein